VVEAFKYLAKTTLTKPVYNFKTVADMLAFLGDVLILIVIETAVVDAVGRGWWALRRLSLVDVEPVDGVVVQDFLLFNFHQVFRKVYQSCSRIHWEFQLSFLVSQVAVPSLLDDRRESGGDALLDPGEMRRHLLPLVHGALVDDLRSNVGLHRGLPLASRDP